MEENITSFLYYLEHIKGASSNTVQSYERDLKYLEIYFLLLSKKVFLYNHIYSLYLLQNYSY